MVKVPDEPRWPAMLATLSSAGLYYALPKSLTVGPTWLLPALTAALLIPTVIMRRRKLHVWNQAFGYLILAVLTMALVASLGLLIAALPAHRETPAALLKSAAALWTSNILVFASWYWRLDAGGPNQRDLRGEHIDGAFLFPQMTMSAEAKEAAGEQNWRPGFVDYLFIAFNSSTAFSPTDSPVLSRWAKLMMMIQSSISLTTIAILAARAVNIL